MTIGDQKQIMETAENYMQKLNKAKSNAEICKIVQEVVELLGPIAQNDPNFKALSQVATKIVTANIKPISTTSKVEKFGSKKMISISGFLDCFNVFKANFKIDITNDDYAPPKLIGEDQAMPIEAAAKQESK